ncbi:MAG: 50S ribosomal protein L9 [Trueperaceae bacterium]
MNVILLEPVDNLGEAGEIVKVRPGYARNFLIPQGLALVASAANKAALEANLAERAKQLAERKADSERLRDMLKDNVLNIKVKAGDDRIYGSVGNQDIADALKATYDVEADRRKIMLAQPIKTIGEYTVVYKPHPEVPIDLKVVIAAE